ncbi:MULTISPECIES: ABC transporter substrate binding protein [unclassified Saccharicrinis]|uniref:ABC transporter substrate binding protein n=1 Tax=unclassified Saccharicrinis TaxID=2646859 RepID=UPI003D34AA92
MCIKKVYILLLLWLVSVVQALLAEVPQRVLYISSYNSSFPTYFDQVEGIRSVLDTVHVEIDIENMDSKRFSTECSLRLFHQWLKNKIDKGLKYDAILVSDDNAFNYALNQKDSLFKDIPIVFFGVNSVVKARLQNFESNITGIVEAISIKETVDLMLELFPDNQQICVLADASYTGMADLMHFRKIAFSKNNIKIIELSLADYSFEEIKRELQKIGNKTPVLLLSFLRDKNNEIKSFDESLMFIKKNLKGPLFHLWHHGINNGIFGGRVISQKHQGEMAASYVYEILKGKNTDSIRVATESPNKYIFDYNELDRFGIDASLLPANSLIINNPQKDFIESYKGELFVGLIFVLIQSVLIFYLLVSIKRRNKVEGDLRSQVDEYHTLNGEYVSLAQEYQKNIEELCDSNIDLINAEKKLKANMAELASKREELRLSEERFRLAINGTNEGVWDWNVDTDELFLSARWKEMLGYSDEELDNKLGIWENLLFEEDRDKALSKIKDLVSDKSEVYEAQFRMKHKSGKLVHVLSRGLAMKNSQGKVYRIIGTHQDLTDRYLYEQRLRDQVEENLSLYEEYRTISEELNGKNRHLLEVEEELRIYIAKLNQKNVQLAESEKKYKQLFNHLSEAFGFYEILLDEKNKPTDYIIHDVNPKFLELHQLLYDEVVNRKASEVFPYKIDHWLEGFGGVAVNGGTNRFVDYLPELDKYFEFHVFSPQLNFFAVIFDDITESVQAKNALMMEKSRNEDILKGTNAGTWDWNLKTSELIINDRWAEIAGYAKDELDPINGDLALLLMNPEDVSHVNETLNKVFKKELDYYDAEFRFKHKNGHWVWIHSRGSIVEWASDGSPIRMTGTHIDITDKKEVELALVESEHRFKTIFDKSKTVMLIIDPENSLIVDANDTAVDFYGYGKTELIGLPMSKINLLSTREIEVEMNNALGEKRNHFKFQHILKSGDIRDVDVFSSPVSVNDHQLLHSIILDTTKSAEAELQIQQVNKRFMGLENIIHYKANSINDLLDFTLKQSMDFTGSDVGAVYHYDQEKGIFYLNNWSEEVNLTHPYTNGDESIENMDCLNKAVKLKEAVIINNPEVNYPFQKTSMLDGGMLKSITIPVLFDDKVVSLFWLATKNSLYSKFHAEQLMLLLDTAWILVEKQRLQDHKG